MKTPREVILARHRAVVFNPQISPEELAGYTRSSAACPARSGPTDARQRIWLVRFWEEAFRPWRRVWLGMAATWVLIFLANADTGDDTPKTFRAKMRAPNPEVMDILREQEQMLVHLLGPADLPRPVEPKPSGPRSDKPLIQRLA